MIVFVFWTVWDITDIAKVKPVVNFRVDMELMRQGGDDATSGAPYLVINDNIKFLGLAWFWKIFR